MINKTNVRSEDRGLINDLVIRYSQLEVIKESIADAYDLMEESYVLGHKLLIAGNGGSASDSEHIAGELMKSFILKRPIDATLKQKMKSIDPVRGEHLSSTLEMPLTAIPLTAHEAVSTAFINDKDPYGFFAQQLLGFGREDDVFLAISTSGNSKNVMNAVVVAKALGIHVIGLTGADGGELAQAADVAVRVPEKETYKIQELHLPIYHCWCMMLEERFFGEKS